MSTSTDFESQLAGAMKSFVSLRCLSGSDYSTQSRLLGYFDRFLVQESEKIPFVSKEVYTKYLATLSHLAPRSLENRISVVRQLCYYLSRNEPTCHIPEIRETKSSSDVCAPYIFSKNQIANLLSQAKLLTPQNSLVPHTYHAIFGLLYSTGIRIGEALALNVEDVYLKRKLIHVKRGKFRKERWVALSESTSLMLEKYLALRPSPKSIENPLFLSLRRTRISHPVVNCTFTKLLSRCGIASVPKPRIHDLRHTFAVHRLLQWYQEGIDVNSCLPSLATYLGHVNIYSTQLYLHATPELLKVVGHNFETHYQKNISGGQHNE